MRGPSGPDLEWRERTQKIRAAARKGKSSTEIAEMVALPVATVERALAHAEHPRLSDPVELLQSRREGPGKAPADVQLYWLGFLTAAGHICGHGSLLTLVVTLGEDGRDCVATLMADLATEHIRYEFCHSSIVGWQVYLRDQGLCEALLPWGIPSDFHGDDPALLDDLPKEFVAPFIRGYTDAALMSRRSGGGSRNGHFALHGTPAVLAGINAMLKRCWAVSSGVVSQRQERTELRVSDSGACHTIYSHLDTFASRFQAERAKVAPRK